MSNYTITDANQADQSFATDLDSAGSHITREGLSFEAQISLGLTDFGSVRKFGANYDIDISAVPEVLSTHGGTFALPVTQANMALYSSSASDTSAGTGARTVTIQGVDTSFAPKEATVTMDGTTPVVVPDGFLSIYRMWVVTTGTGRVNDGTITIDDSGGNAVADIVAGKGQSLIGIFTVPAGYTALLLDMYAEFLFDERTAAAEVALVTLDGSVATSSHRTKHILGLGTAGNSRADYKYPIPQKISEKTHIYMSVIEVSDDNTSISGGFTLILVPNA